MLLLNVRWSGQDCRRLAATQRFADGNLADVRVFKKADELTWLDSGGPTFTQSWSELRDWLQLLWASVLIGLNGL